MLNFHQSLSFLNWLFPFLHFPQEFPARISHKIFPQQFPTRFSRKNFLQEFPTRFSRKIFLSWILIGWLPITLFQMLNFHQSLSFLNWLFPLLHFPQEFPARISRKIFPQEFPARFSRKNFPQDFPATISRFSATISRKIFRKIFLSWILIGWLPITLFQMLNFHQSLSFLNWLFPLLHFPQEFPARISRTRISCKNFLQDFPARISRKNFPQEFPARFSTISRKIFLSWILIGWLPITLFQMLNFHQSLSFLNWLFPLLHFPQKFPARISRKIIPQEFPARFSRNNFPQDFPATISRKIFPQDFPELDTDWLAPHHPIPNAKFPPITVFLKLALFPISHSYKIFPQDFPARISRKIFPQEFPARFSRKNFPQDFPQDFPARISHKIFPQDFPELDTDWLAPHHPIPNAKFPPITVFLKLAFSLLHFPQEFPARISRKIFPQDFPARSQKNFPQEFPTRFSRNNFPQDFPARFS